MRPGWFLHVLALLMLPVTHGRLLARETAGLNETAVARGEAKTNSLSLQDETDVYYMPRVLDQLKLLAQNTHQETLDRFQAEKDRLWSVAQTLPVGSPDRNAIDLAAKITVEGTMATEIATLELLQFYFTSKAMMGSKATAPHCRFLACGDHAACEPTPNGRYRCACKECYEGDGFVCRRVLCQPKSIGSAQPVRGPIPMGYPAVPRQAPGQVAELQMAVFAHDRLAVVLRDADDGNRGSLILGRVVDSEVKWGLRQYLAPTAAYGTTITGLPNGRLLLGFRDKENGGDAYVIGGEVKKGELQAVLAAPKKLGKDQSEHMVFVPMASSRVVCLYAEKTADAHGNVVRAWGSAALMEVLGGGLTRHLGTYHFSEGSPLSRLTAVALSPTSMVVGYRALPPRSSGKPEENSRELSALWIGMEEDELVVDPHPIAIESEHGAMLERDMALVAQNTFAYSYESSLAKVLKLAIVKVDPSTHRMSVVGGPSVLAEGKAEFVHSVSLPLFPGTPSAMTVFQLPKENSKLELCRVSPEGRVADCHMKVWADQELRAVSGGRLPDGRLIFAMADSKGTLLYQILTQADLGPA